MQNSNGSLLETLLEGVGLVTTEGPAQISCYENLLLEAQLMDGLHCDLWGHLRVH